MSANRNNFMRTFSVFIVTSLFLTLSTHAGVGSVGHGGGLSEMKFIYLFQNSNQWIQLCLQKSDLCALSSTDKNIFTALSEKNEWFSQFDILFKPDMTSFYTESMVNGQRTLTIKSNDLLKNDQPQSLLQLLARVLAVQSDLISASSDLDQQIAKFESIYSNFTFDDQSFVHAAGQNEYKLHFFQTTKLDKALSFILLEDNIKTISLDEVFKVKYPQIDLYSLAIQQIQFTEQGGRYWIFGSMSINLKNGQPSIYRTIRMSFETDANGSIDPNKISVQLGLK